MLAGDFNTLAPGATLDVGRLPLRLRPFVWLSGGRINWRTIQTVLDAGYVDAFRVKHPDDPGLTFPPATRSPTRLRVRPRRLHRSRRRLRRRHHPDAARASDHHPVVLDLVT